jgi:hypothetical protein
MVNELKRFFPRVGKEWPKKTRGNGLEKFWWEYIVLWKWCGDIILKFGPICHQAICWQLNIHIYAFYLICYADYI